MNVRLRNVQALRACAASIVVLNHLPDLERKVLGRPGLLAGSGSFGAAGVDLFFAISGFIMMVTMWENFGRPGAAGRFVSRRALRIFPLYLIAIGLFAVDRALEHRALHFDARGLASSLTLLPVGDIPFGVAWSLQFEMFFYYVFAVALFFDRRRLPFVVGTWALVTLGLNLSGAPGLLGFAGSPLAYEFIGGMLVGVLSVRAHFHASRIATIVGALAFVAACLSFAPYAGLASNALAWHRTLTAGLASLVLLYGVVGCEHVHRIVAPRALVDLGDASYSMYLMHGFLIGIVADVFVRAHANGVAFDVIFLAVAYAAVCAGSIGIFHVVERPIMSTVKRLTAVRPMTHGVDEAIAPSIA